MGPTVDRPPAPGRNRGRPTDGFLNFGKITTKPLCCMCCCDPGAFCTAMLCPCIVHGKIAEATGKYYAEECRMYCCTWCLGPCAAALYHVGVAVDLRRQTGIEAE